MYNFDNELSKALKLSQESFKIEQNLRKQAKKLEELMKQKKINEQSEEKSYQTLINLMKWNEIFIQRGVGTGIQNLGNSCFMNATLQCLAYTPPFAQLLCQSNHSSHCQASGFCTLCEMEKVIPSMLMSKNIVKPRHLFKNLSKINDLLTAGCQEDSHEFIQSLLDKMENAYDDQQKAANNNSKAKDPQNPIRKLFTGSTKTCIQCARCKTKSITKEPFCCISLEVDDNVGLGEALEIFTQNELMRGDDKYFCNECNRKCIAHKRLTFSDIPPILILHFKRFCVEFAASHHRQGSTKKLADHVEFPELLDFKSLKNLIFEDDQQRVLIDSEYELYAVLVHSGPQLGYGHYYALIKSSDNYWFRMNDMDVIPVNTKHVLREQGYMVFYKRKTDNLMKCHLERIRAQHQSEEIVENEEEQKEAMDVRVFDKEQNENGNGIKVDTDLLTTDYFANSCNMPQDIVMVDAVNEKFDDIDLNAVSDKKSYVNVPPIATRPELSNNGNQNENDAVEVFWPVKNMD